MPGSDLSGVGSDAPRAPVPFRAPLLIALPHGLNVSGVTMWAIRLAGALVQRGRGVALLLHREPRGQDRLNIPIHEAVEHIDATGLPAFGEVAGDLSPFIETYRDAADRLAERCGGPVVLSPNLHGDCYGVAAALCTDRADSLRTVAWQHADVEDGLPAEHHRAVRELVACQQFPAESIRALRRADGAHDPAVGIDDLPRAAEDGDRGVGVHEPGLSFEAIGGALVVGVHAGDERGAGVAQGVVECGGEAGTLTVNHANPRVGGFEAVNPGQHGRVGPVGHQQDLDLRRRLPGETSEGAIEPVGILRDGQNGADTGIPAGAGVGPGGRGARLGRCGCGVYLSGRAAFRTDG